MGFTKKTILSITGGLIFSLGDMAHVHTGTASYPNWEGPMFFNIPFWVPLEFAVGAFLLMSFLKLPVRKSSHALFAASFAWSLLIYIATSYLPESDPVLKNAILYGAVGIQLYWNRLFDARSLAQITGVALGGSLFEFILGEKGIFTYQESPSLIATIPLWLPCIYASVAVTVGQWEKN